MLVDSTPVDDVPLRDLFPDQPPEAEHDVAFALLHSRIELAPAPIVLGLAAMLTTGGVGLTETLTVCEARPPGPVQSRV